jgi:oligoribonuclease (3'-5' exoribonuclease)
MLLFLDLETTGFDPTNDSIIEIAAKRINENGKVVDSFTFLVKTDESTIISSTVENLTGITKSLLDKEGVPLEEMIYEFQGFLKDDDIIVGHNISFDTSFLKENGIVMNNKEIDTFFLSILVLGNDEESYSLEVLSEKYGLLHEDAHRAMSDVEANISLYYFLEIKWIELFDEAFYKFLLDKTKDSNFYERNFFINSFHKKSSIENKNIPLRTFKKFEDTWNTGNIDSKEVIENFYNTDKSIFWDTYFPYKNIPLLLNSIKKDTDSVTFFYPDKKANFYFKIFKNLNNSLNKNFIFSYQRLIDKKKYDNFLNKKTYTRIEIIVLLKLRKLQDLEVGVGNFMGEEKKVLKDLLQTEYSENIPINYQVLFLPFSYFSLHNKNEKTVILDGEQVEDLVTSEQTKKIFTKLWKEENNKLDNFNIWKDFLDKFALFIRKEKGENIYPLGLPYTQWLKNWEFKLFIEEGEKILNTLNHENFLEWKIFFSENSDSNLFFQIRLFGDNELEFSYMPIKISNQMDKLFAYPKLLMGNGFPVYKNKIIYSFDLPIDYLFIKEKLPKINNFLLPEENRMITSNEIIPYINKLIDKQENIIVSVSSKKSSDDIIALLQEVLFENKNYSLIFQGLGGIGKTRIKLSKLTHKIIVAQPKFLDRLNLEDFVFDSIVIFKPSFDPPKDPFLSKRRALFFHDFEEFSLPRALARFEREVKRVKNPKNIFVGDGRIKNEKSWSRVFYIGS